MAAPALVCWVHWIPLLQARADGQPYDLRLGKVDVPRLPLIPDGLSSRVSEPVKLYLVAQGRLRAHVPLSALRNTVQGFVFELRDLAALEPVTVRGLVLPWWRGAREPDWKATEEIPFPGWATEGIPAHLQHEGTTLAARTRRPVPVAPPPAARGRTSCSTVAANAPTHQPGLFGGIR